MREKLPPRKKLIFLTEEPPFPATGGGKLRDLYLLSLFSRDFDVKVLTFNAAKNPAPQEATAATITLPIGVEIRSMPNPRNSIWAKLRGRFRSYVMNGYSIEMEKALEESSPLSRLLWISRLGMAKYIPVAQKLGYFTVLDEHNIESDLLLSLARKKPWNPFHLYLALDCRLREIQFCRQVNHVIAVSDSDAERLYSLMYQRDCRPPYSRITTIPNRIDTRRFQEAHPGKGRTLLFVGTLNYQPNIEGLQWFLDLVLPLLRHACGADLPPIRVIGAHPDPTLRAQLASAQIELIQNPVSIVPYLKDAAIVFVPLLSGSGTRLKIIEAMAAGRAIVSTRKGAEGLELTPQKEIALADTPQDFARALHSLWQDPLAREEMGKVAAQHAQTQYDWTSHSQKILEKIHQFYENSTNR